MKEGRKLAVARGRYDAEVDAFAIRFAPEGAQYDISEEVGQDVVLDFDTAGKVIAIEVLGVSRVFGNGDDPPRIGPSQDRLQEAFSVYVARFGGQHSPFLFGLHTVEEIVVATARLRHALAENRPLRWWHIMAALGIERPPKGALL